MTVTATDIVTPCVQYANVYLHPLMEESESANTQASRREYAMLRSQGDKLCGSCPLLAECLTNAVTQHDVAGFVAGTTSKQRREIRVRLGITVDDDDFDTYAGVNSGRQFDRNEIYRLRQANPTEPLSAIAARMGCSVSTVKRHLRRIEREGIQEQPKPAAKPTPDQVMAAAREVLHGTPVAPVRAA